MSSLHTITHLFYEWENYERAAVQTKNLRYVGLLLANDIGINFAGNKRKILSAKLNVCT